MSGGRPPDEGTPYPGRRQLDTLTAADLDDAGVWWFPGPDGHLSGPDDATVMPLDASIADAHGALTFPPGRYLLRAAFALADGSRVTGHVTWHAPGDSGALRDREPTICTQQGQIPLWHGVLVPSEEETALWLGWLGRPREAVFPLTWSAELHPPGDDLAGHADGFEAVIDGTRRAV